MARFGLFGNEEHHIGGSVNLPSAPLRSSLRGVARGGSHPMDELSKPEVNRMSSAGLSGAGSGGGPVADGGIPEDCGRERVGGSARIEVDLHRLPP